ncbi:unnamed protein product [Urochloa humidicola]
MEGHTVHGIRDPAHFTATQAALAARANWLTDKQYYAILTNTEHYQALNRQNMNIQADAVVQGNQDCLFLCDRAAVDPNAYTLTDDPELVWIGNTVRMTMVRSYTSNYERREYFSRTAGPKIIHFGRNRDLYRQDMARAAENAEALRVHMQDRSEASVQNQNAIAGEIAALGRGQRGRRGGRQGPN